jgi:hypothetical protein
MALYFNQHYKYFNKSVYLSRSFLGITACYHLEGDVCVSSWRVYIFIVFHLVYTIYVNNTERKRIKFNSDTFCRNKCCLEATFIKCYLIKCGLITCLLISKQYNTSSLANVSGILNIKTIMWYMRYCIDKYCNTRKRSFLRY